MYEILLLCTALCAIFLYLAKQYTSRHSDDVSGIPKVSVVQLLLHIFRNRPHFDTVKILHSLTKTYGETFLIHIKPFAPIVITSDPKYFGQILASKDHLIKSDVYELLRNIFGDGLLVAELDTWRHDRKILNDVFDHESHKEYLERLDQMLHQLEDVILERIHAPIDMQEVLHEFSMHTTIESLKDPCVAWDSKRTNEYYKTVSEYRSNNRKRLLPLILNMDIFFKMTQSYRAIQKSVKIIKQFGVDFVDAHLKLIDQQIDANNIVYKLHEAGVPSSRIADNVILFIEGGHETIAATLAYSIFEIAKNPEVQNQIFAEIEAIIGKDRNAAISAADVYRMTYTNGVIKEGLRIHAAVPFVTRKLNKSIVVNNAFLPKDTNVIFFMDGLHKSEKCHANPLVFNPDRFAAENKPNLVANAWAPFALGIRNCIGQSLAMQEAVLILAKMVRRYHFFPIVPEHAPDVRSSFVTRSSNGVPVLVKVRA